jgi:hypothetical protein
VTRKEVDADFGEGRCRTGESANGSRSMSAKKPLRRISTYFDGWQTGANAGRWLHFFARARRRDDVTSSVKHHERHRRKVIRTTVSYPSSQRPLGITWSESFIFAGGSAFLLLVAVLFPDYWYVSFFALTPFLYRIVKATPRECLGLGLFFGLSFFTLSVVNSLVTSPLASVLKILSGTALFALFGWSLGWARQRWGFNPFILVFLWVGLELGLVKLGFVGGLLGETGFSHPFFGGLTALFGFLAVSAIIVLLNSLLVLTIVKTLRITGFRGRAVQEDEGILDIFSTRRLFAEGVHLVPESRAPPYLIFQNSNRKSLVDLKCRAGFSRVR